MRVEHTPWQWAMAMAMPAIAVVLMWRALKAGGILGSWARVVSWIGTTAGTALLAFLLDGNWEYRPAMEQGWMILVSALLPVLVAVLIVIRESRAWGLKEIGRAWIFEVTTGAILFAGLTVLLYAAWLKGFAEPLHQRVLNRWAEIGHPLPEFERSLKPVAENDSLRTLTRDLAGFGVVTFYKSGSLKAGKPVLLYNKTDVAPQEILDFLNDEASAESDSVVLPAPASAALEGHARDFDRLYSGILQREPAVWDWNPADGVTCSMPHFITARMISQWIAADAFRHLEQRDDQGAANAVNAGLRMTQTLGGKQPTVVSFMIRVAIEGIFARVVARLPEEPAARASLVQEVETKRRDFVRMEEAEVSAFETSLSRQRSKIENGLSPVEPLPGWCRRGLSPWLTEIALAGQNEDSLDVADFVAILRSAARSAEGDFGEQAMNRIDNRSVFAPVRIGMPNLARAWLRTNGVLLLREQAEMIRLARAQMQAGNAGNLAEFQSVVVPGSKWEVTEDAGANSIKIRLAPLPTWTRSKVFDNQFFLLPLDGSRSWQLNRRVLASTTR